VDPPGLVSLAVLPPGLEVVAPGNDPVYYVDGRFYRYDEHSGRYVQVAVRPDWTVSALPPGFEVLQYKGDPIYRVGEAYFRFDDLTERYLVVLASR
tara:strand:+ start:1777 stop:2064 length:288 start_codon:yes stop_codon:yes gene_type:complete